MLTSGSSLFALASDDALTEAWERCGLSPATLTGDVARSARRSMQLMLLDWTNRGLNLWQVDRWDRAVAVGEAALSCPEGTADVLDVSLSDGRGYALSLAMVTRDEWARLPGDGLRGRPTQCWCERGRDAVVLHLWPVPERAYALSIGVMRLPEDVGALHLSPDAPVLWAEAVASGLAARLALKFAPPARYGMLKQEAAEAYANASGENRERAPMRITPDLTGY